MDLEGALGEQLCLLLCRVLVELEAVSVTESARGQGLGHQRVDHLVRSFTRQGYQAMVGGIHTRKPHLAPYYTADGLSVLPPGAPLVLQVLVGRIQWPADASMQHLVRPLVPKVSYWARVLNGLLAGPSS